MPPEEREMSFSCECGGDITKIDNFWECNICNFKKKDSDGWEL